MKIKGKSNYKYGTYLPLKIKKEQLLVKLKGILKVHSKVDLDFVARKLGINRNEIKSLIYEIARNDQLDIIMIDKDTIALKKLLTKDLVPNLPEKTITENLDKLYSLERCIICNKEIDSLDDIAVCPHCANIAHKAEFLEWIKIKQKCPVCKKKLQAEELMIKAKK